MGHTSIDGLLGPTGEQLAWQCKYGMDGYETTSKLVSYPARYLQQASSGGVKVDRLGTSLRLRLRVRLPSSPPRSPSKFCFYSGLRLRFRKLMMTVRIPLISTLKLNTFFFFSSTSSVLFYY